jgi:hypothetical protein
VLVTLFALRIRLGMDSRAMALITDLGLRICPAENLFYMFTSDVWGAIYWEKLEAL